MGGWDRTGSTFCLRGTHGCTGAACRFQKCPPRPPPLQNHHFLAYLSRFLWRALHPPRWFSRPPRLRSGVYRLSGGCCRADGGLTPRHLFPHRYRHSSPLLEGGGTGGLILEQETSPPSTSSVLDPGEGIQLATRPPCATNQALLQLPRSGHRPRST